MLEAKIELLTAAVIELTRVMREQTMLVELPASQAKEVLKEVSVKIEDLPNDKPKSKPTPDTSPASSNESAPVTYDDVKRITIKVSEVSRDKAKAALSRFGVPSAKALPVDAWPDYVQYMTRVANGEVDPEASHE
jgi:hypothetical protein